MRGKMAAALLASFVLSALEAGRITTLTAFGLDPAAPVEPFAPPPIEVNEWADLYLPAGRTRDLGNDTLVVFVHGGSWTSGTHKDALFGGHAWLGRTLASGPDAVATAVVSYPKGSLWRSLLGNSDRTYIPKQVDSIVRTLMELQALTCARTTVMIGHSAGSHLAASLAMVNMPSNLYTFIGASGIYDPETMEHQPWPVGAVMKTLYLDPVFGGHYTDFFVPVKAARRSPTERSSSTSIR